MVHHMDETNSIPITETLQIPLSEIDFRFSPSRGPGGQHVNRAHTRATLLFDVAKARSLDEPTREKLLQTLAARLDSHGVLQVSAQDTRSQNQNRELAIARFIAIVSEALEEQPERVATKPSTKAKQKRLDEKKKQSKRKQERRQDWSKDD